MTQIRECGRTVAGDLVAFDIQWDGDLAGDDVAWAALICSPDNSEEVRLVHRLRAGEAQQYVEGAQGRQDVEIDADVREDDAIVRFPASVVGVAVDWPTWVAVLAVDGEEIAREAIPPRS
jgi:hypothetical protein